MGISGTTNIDELFDDIHELIDGFNFTAQVEDKTLGLDCAGIIADGIAERSIDEQRGEAGAWVEIDERYEADKLKKYGVKLIGVRTGQMLSIESLLGTVNVSTTDVQMLYGTGRAPTTSSVTGYITDGDKSITDTEKADFFSAMRPFYELDDVISDRVYARIEHCLEEYLTRNW